jgi:poly(3-hydroxybutyrate) depolymerase
VKQKLWEKYLYSFKPVAKEALQCHADTTTGVSELSAQAHHRASSGPSLSTFRGSIEEMKISYFVIGEKPIDKGYPLYICLHGGGGTHPSVNEGQWKHMQEYYRDSVSVGVYIAARGITDTWNVHFVDRSYELYDKLITYMILCWDVDPNRVYLLGYSAGGDGVYHIAPKMADRWAGANMSAGHPNGVSLVNLYHVPFVIQVGECDSAYNRNKVGAEYGLKLRELKCAS